MQGTTIITTDTIGTITAVDTQGQQGQAQI
jgi:hypothetical protein